MPVPIIVAAIAATRVASAARAAPSVIHGIQAVKVAIATSTPAVHQAAAVKTVATNKAVAGAVAKAYNTAVGKAVTNTGAVQQGAAHVAAHITVAK